MCLGGRVLVVYGSTIHRLLVLLQLGLIVSRVTLDVHSQSAASAKSKQQPYAIIRRSHERLHGAEAHNYARQLGYRPWRCLLQEADAVLLCRQEAAALRIQAFARGLRVRRRLRAALQAARYVDNESDILPGALQRCALQRCAPQRCALQRCALITAQVIPWQLALKSLFISIKLQKQTDHDPEGTF